MKNIEMKDLILGLLTIVLLASSVGKLDQLHDFAKVQVVKSLHGWKPHHFFIRQVSTHEKGTRG